MSKYKEICTHKVFLWDSLLISTERALAYGDGALLEKDELCGYERCQGSIRPSSEGTVVGLLAELTAREYQDVKEYYKQKGRSSERIVSLDASGSKAVVFI